MVGFVVTPTTCWSRISPARLPLVRRSRDRSSSQIDTPASESAARLSLLLMCLQLLSRILDFGKRAARGVSDGVGRDPELAEQGREVGRSAEVLDRHDFAGVADKAVP